MSKPKSREEKFILIATLISFVVFAAAFGFVVSNVPDRYVQVGAIIASMSLMFYGMGVGALNMMKSERERATA